MAHTVQKAKTKKELEENISELKNKIAKIEHENTPGSTSIVKVWSSYNEIARLAALGVKQKKIAEAVGMTQSTISILLNHNPHVKERIAILQGKKDASTVNVKAKIRALQGISLEALEEDLLIDVEENSTARTLRNKTALELLKMGGNGPISKVEASTGIFTLDDLKEISSRAKAIRSRNLAVDEIKNQEIEEIEYSEVE